MSPNDSKLHSGFPAEPCAWAEPGGHRHLVEQPSVVKKTNEQKKQMNSTHFVETDTLCHIGLGMSGFVMARAVAEPKGRFLAGLVLELLMGSAQARPLRWTTDTLGSRGWRRSYHGEVFHIVFMHFSCEALHAPRTPAMQSLCSSILEVQRGV